MLLFSRVGTSQEGCSASTIAVTTEREGTRVLALKADTFEKR